MAITTLAEYKSAAKIKIKYQKATRTTIAAQWSTLLDASGDPVNSTLSLTATANGAVPATPTNAPYPDIPDLGAGTYYISKVIRGGSASGRYTLYDRVFHCGAYAFNANTTLTSQPSYSSRMPGGSYVGTELWIEVATPMTGALAVTVTYTNQAGTTGRTTGSFSIASGAVAGRMFRLPLQSGDCGIQTIESVTGATATAGTFNIVVVRPLVSWRQDSIVDDGAEREMNFANGEVGLPVIFTDSALAVMCAPDSTSSGSVDLDIEVCSG